jgi:hypothetical protein
MTFTAAQFPNFVKNKKIKVLPKLKRKKKKKVAKKTKKK